MDLPLDTYDLSRIICFIQPDSQYATWAFDNLRNNRAQLAPRLHDTSVGNSEAVYNTDPVIQYRLYLIQYK